MGLDFSTLVYLPTQDMFGRSVTFVPYKSQPGGPAYGGRGIFDTKPIDLIGEDGQVYAEQVTILDIREREFAVLPLQGDHVIIPADGDVPPPSVPGEYEIITESKNGGGETTLVLRLIRAAP
jgi:hypothetical protein